MEKEHLKITINDEDSENSKDIDREEMKWTDKQEAYFEKILSECLSNQKKHDIKAHQFKKKYIYMSIPAIILPLLFASINEFLVDNYNYINTSAMMVSGVLSGINSFFNFGKKFEKHNQYAGLYDNLAGEIEVMLAKNKKFRIPCDVAMEKIKNQYTNLNSSAPML